MFGRFKEPLTLHKYLYCLNGPANGIDPTGRTLANQVGALVAGTAAHSAAINTAATGVMRDNETLIDWGMQMEHLVAPAMLLGAVVGPYLPSLPGAATDAAVAAWELIVQGGSAAAGGISVGAKALSYWAIANPYEFISVLDVLTQVGGPPDSLPVTPAGFVMWLYMSTRDLD